MILTENQSKRLIILSGILIIISFVITGNMYRNTDNLKNNLNFSIKHDTNIKKSNWKNITDNIVKYYGLDKSFVEIANFKNRDGINYDNISTQYWDIYLKNNNNPDYNIADEKSIEEVKKNGYKFTDSNTEIIYYPNINKFKIGNIELSDKAFADRNEIPSNILSKESLNIFEIQKEITEYNDKLINSYIPSEKRDKIKKQIENDINYNGIFNLIRKRG